jgi:signal transduction histidine kinase
MERTLTTVVGPGAPAAPAPRADAASRADQRREAWIVIGAAFSFATLIALLDASQTYLSMLEHGHSWSSIFTWQLLIWWSWAAMTPVVRALGRRFPFGRDGRLRFAAIHLVAAAGLALVHMVPVTLATVIINPFAPMVTREHFGERYLPFLLSWLHVEVILYWMVLAVWQAFDYRQTLRERELRASQLEALLSTAALEALKLRLHPHFLFNSLNAVAGLVRKNENEAAIKTLAGLSELLRYILDGDGQQMVPLEKELAFAERYLEIQRFRFSDRLSYTIDLPPELADVAVPNLILQPIVENALEHGFARTSGPGSIDIRVAGDETLLRISVSDTGPGPGRIERWGIGLADTNARLHELYRDHYEVRVEPREGSGTVVTLEFQPARSVAVG